MNFDQLAKEAKNLTWRPKGILAIDESLHTCNERFEKLGVPPTEENRRAYRELLVTAPLIEQYVSGMILFDETFRQKTVAGVPFIDVLKQKGISVGIKVDEGTVDLALHPGEKITEGLDGLRARMAEYKKNGATFAKWRAVITIDVEQKLPSEACLYANAHALARYAALCQEAGLVPIVEAEVIMDGKHSIDDCFTATSRTLDHLFKETTLQGLFNAGMLLKTGMVVSGSTCPIQASSDEVAEKTLACLTQHVPADIGGVVFLSGGQSEKTATDHLYAIHTHAAVPWPLTFSFGRAIQNPALQIWAENSSDREKAQQALVETAKKDSDAVAAKAS